MSRVKSCGLGLAGVVAVVVVIWCGSTRRDSPDVPGLTAEGHSTPVAAVAGVGVFRTGESMVALDLTAGTIADDVRHLQDLFAQWQFNFPGAGNPVGTNAEIMAVFSGDNALKLDLIPRDHPAINARGELCDRWGTPFRFHQLSGIEMQIISAGPDRDFATADDITSQ